MSKLAGGALALGAVGSCVVVGTVVPGGGAWVVDGATGDVVATVAGALGDVALDGPQPVNATASNAARTLRPIADSLNPTAWRNGRKRLSSSAPAGAVF